MSKILLSYFLSPVLTQAARVVVTWLNKAREAEEKRNRADAEPLAPDGDGADATDDDDDDDEDDDEDQEEFVYDIQVWLKNCPLGKLGWLFVCFAHA